LTSRIDAGSLYGTLNLLVLQALADGPQHGLGVARRILAGSGEQLQVEEGALYPALHRLERDGLLQARWGTSENNRRARFYELTPRGRGELAREAARWRRHAAAVRGLLDGGAGPSRDLPIP
jgi:PadR family transcriptional regulator, regulatory protein PadR